MKHTIYTGQKNFIFSTSAGVQVDRIDEAIKAIVEEYAKIRSDKVPEEELQKAKNYMKGKMVLRLEDSEQQAHLLGKYELLHGSIMSPSKIMKALDAVTVDQIHEVAKEILAQDRLRVGVIGPYDNKARFEKLLK
jgi:predicted Zn-dependent peptidase